MVAEQPTDEEVFKDVLDAGEQMVEQLWAIYPKMVLSMDEETRDEFLKSPCIPLTNRQLMVMLAYTVGLEKLLKDPK